MTTQDPTHDSAVAAMQAAYTGSPPQQQNQPHQEGGPHRG